MTRANAYHSVIGRDDRNYYFIDGKRVSQERYADSFDRSLRAYEQQRQGIRAEEAAGRFVPRERIERLPRTHEITVTTLISRERIRGTRHAVIVRHVLPMDQHDALLNIESQYDRGGNYVLGVRSVRQETRNVAGSDADIYEEYDMGEDGSADES